jgi:Tol biopolymer transport system component
MPDPSGKGRGDDCAPPPNSLWLLYPGQSKPEKISLHAIPERDVSSFSWAPDSKRLAFDTGGEQCDFPGTAGQVYLLSLDTQGVRKLSVDVPSRSPFFSPDGTAVLFTDFSGGDSPIVMIKHLRTGGLVPLPGQASGDAGDYDRVVAWR